MRSTSARRDFHGSVLYQRFSFPSDSSFKSRASSAWLMPGLFSGVHIGHRRRGNVIGIWFSFAWYNNNAYAHIILSCVHIGHATAGPCQCIGAPGRNRTCNSNTAFETGASACSATGAYKNGPPQPRASVAGESVVRNSVATLRCRSREPFSSPSTGELADSNRPDFGTCLLYMPHPRAGLARYKMARQLRIVERLAGICLGLPVRLELTTCRLQICCSAS